MKICLIGCGTHANDVYVPSFNKLSKTYDDIELAACCDIKEDKAEALQRKCLFRRKYTDYSKMIRETEPDAVFIVAPYNKVAEITEDICRLSACPIMIEKPPGASVAEALRIKKAFDAGDRLHQIAFNRHFMPSYLALKEKMTETGSVQHIEYSMIRMNRNEPTFYSTAIHGIDIVRFLIGSDYEYCEFMYQDLNDLGNNCYNMHIMARFASGTTGYLSFLVQSGITAERASVTAKNEMFVLTTPIWNGADTPGKIQSYRDGRLIRHMVFDEDALFITNGFYDEIAHFLYCVRMGNQCKHTSIDAAIQSMEIAECLRNRKLVYKQINN